MKLVVAGTRTLKFDQKTAILSNLLDAFNLDPTEIVSGGARGIDTMGANWAKENCITLKEFLPDWTAFGSAAGPMRNRQMAEYGDVLLLIWDGNSPGSMSMKREMVKVGKPVFEVILKSPKS